MGSAAIDARLKARWGLASPGRRAVCGHLAWMREPHRRSFKGRSSSGERALESPVRPEIGPARRWGRDHLRSRSRGANSKRQPHVDRASRCSTRLKAANYHPHRSSRRATSVAGFHVEQDHGWSGVDITGWPLFSVHFAVPYGFRSTTSTRRNRSFKGAALQPVSSFDSPVFVAPCDPQPDLISSPHQRIAGAPHALDPGTASSRVSLSLIHT